MAYTKQNYVNDQIATLANFQAMDNALYEHDTALAACIHQKYVHNLLDNSDFRNPVNQRGNTTYNGSSYSIDRWSLQYSTSLSLVAGSHIALDGSWNMKQRITGLKTGQTYTFAVCARCGGESFTAHMGIDNPDAVLMPLTNKWTVYTHTLSLTDSSNDVHYVSVSKANSSGELHLMWAALYEGEYTSATLPDYAPKGYAAEFAECQRYYRKYPVNAYIGVGQSSSVIAVPFRLEGTDMRINPTVTISNAAVFQGGSWRDLSGSTAVDVSTSYISCSLNAASGITINDSYRVRFAIELSADL